MSLNAPSAVDAIVSPGNVPGLRKLLVKLTLMRAGNATDTQDEVDTSTLADDLDIPSSLAGIGQFVRLSEIAEVAKGPTGIKDARPGPYPLVVTAEDRGSCDHYDFEGEAVLIPTVSSTGHGDASLKRIHYQEGRFAVGSILAAVRVRDRALHSTRFLYEYLSVFKDELLVARMSGTANVSLTVKKIEGVPIPLIPIAQQQHLHDLMRLCDALEAKGRLEAEQHARLLGTLLGTLTDSATPERPVSPSPAGTRSAPRGSQVALGSGPAGDLLAANWQRVADHFDLLLDRPEAVDALEQTILQLAVRGLLVPQDANDEPAETLLSRIRAHKARMVLAGELRAGKTIEEIGEDEQPFSLPNGWAWARFGDATINRDGERVPVSSSDRERRAKVYDYYGASGVIDKIDGYLFDKTLLLIGEDGANLLNRATPIAFLAHGKYWVNNHAHVIDTMDPGLMRYVEMFINAISLEPYVTGTAQPKMNQAKMNSIVVALPPLAEQARIVSRVTELRRLCADLRQRLTASQTTQSHLAEALVEQVAA